MSEQGMISESEVALGEVIASRYEILGRLGHGAAGAVYSAHDRVLDETVALKLLRHLGPDGAWTAERFRSEVKLARRVAHPNVCRIYEYGEHNDRPFLSMELIEGATVKQQLAVRGTYTMSAALDVTMQVADALEAIHRAGIVHRDLKPQNLIEDRYGTVKVTDFGIATSTPPEAGPDAFARYVAGTPEYMSPEQVRGLPVDARSDVYALGIVLFELLAGHVPFPVTSPSETFPLHLREDRPLPASSGFPIPVDAILRRSLARARDDRYPSAAAMAQAVRRAKTELARLDTGPRIASPAACVATLTHPPTEVPETVATPPPTARPVWAAVSLLLVAIVAGWLVANDTTAPRVSPAAEVPARVRPSPKVVRPAAAVPTSRGTTMRVAPPEVTVSHPDTVPPAEESDIAENTSSGASPTRAPLEGENAEPQRVASIVPLESEARPGDAGWLQLGIRPWAHVFVDGVALGTSPLRRVSLSAGLHTVRVENPDYEPLARKVRIRSGEITALRIDLPMDAIRR